jgi:putative exporter of polyketide antibiotics
VSIPVSIPKNDGFQMAGRSTGKDTSQLLKAGISLLVAGVIAVFLITVAFGGIHHHGPHTNTGWTLLIVAMMCLPLGTVFSLLGAAKWLRDHRHRQRL